MRQPAIFDGWYATDVRRIMRIRWNPQVPRLVPAGAGGAARSSRVRGPRRRRGTFSLLALLVAGGLGAGPAGGAVRGRLLAPDGGPVVGARVEVLDGEARSRSDDLGYFGLHRVSPPVSLRIRHPAFEERTVEVAAGESGPVEVFLVPRTGVEERVEVRGSRAGDGFSPTGLASTPVHLREVVVPPSTLTEAVVQAAGVSENGQGGRLQVFSIRGISRHRVLNLIAGARIVGERRAGVSTGFVDPLLVREVDVLRGPATTYFGAGALGGAIQVEPRTFQGLWAQSGYETQGDANVQAFGWGHRGWSLGLVRRQAGDGEAAAGTRLHNAFEQYSASLRKSWQTPRRTAELLLIPSYGLDIGKANTDFPHRATRYPRQRHLLVRLGLDHGLGGRIHVYAHPHSLDTRVVEGDERQDVSSRGLDFGAHWERPLVEGPRLGARVSVDYFGRRGVTTEEGRFVRKSPSGATAKTLSGGREDEMATSAVLHWSRGRARLETGTRLTWLGQSNRGAATRRRWAWTGFLSGAVPLAPRLDALANVGTGQRFPSLGEGFFTGTTGRGQVLGNPELDSETSRSGEVGLRWLGERAFVRGAWFKTRIGDYIERIELAPDLLTFRNLTSGTLEGFEIEGLVELAPRTDLTWGGHRLSGRDDAGAPLADIPPDELRLAFRVAAGVGQWAAQLRWRGGKDQLGSGEKEIPSAVLLGASLRLDAGRHLGSGTELLLVASNLLDEDYFPAADRKASPAPGRSVGVSLVWSRP